MKKDKAGRPDDTHRHAPYSSSGPVSFEQADPVVGESAGFCRSFGVDAMLDCTKGVGVGDGGSLKGRPA